MSADGMDVAVTEKGSVRIGVDDGGDYAKLDDHVRLSQVELQRARSAVDVAVPWLVWPVFVLAIMAGSSSAVERSYGLASNNDFFLSFLGGAWGMVCGARRNIANPVDLFGCAAQGRSDHSVVKAMYRAGPVSSAGWRHQVTTLVMLPFFLAEWRRLPKFDRSKVFTFRCLGLYLIAALGLSGNLGFYFWSLEHTSMMHSLFLVGMPPIFVAIYTRLVGRVLLTAEMVGVGLGIVGAAVLAAGTKLDQDNMSTHLGDFVAILSAISMASYLIAGKKLRSWMPLFVYQFPVTLLATVILVTVGLLMEGWNESEVGDISGPFGWIRKEYILGTLFLGIAPGFIGHAGYGFVLRYSSPLVMPTGLSLQPIIGSALGWAFGQSPLPGIWTVVGGIVTLAGTLFVSCASAQKTVLPIFTSTSPKPTVEPYGQPSQWISSWTILLYETEVENKEEENEDGEYKQPAIDDEEGQQGTKPLLQPSELS